jgi:START-like superfamily domain
MVTLGMTKKKLFAADYEIHASIKMLYPYIQTAGGLSEWFADDVKINNEDKTYTFFWDNEEHRARQSAHRTNHFARFEFLPENDADVKDPSYFELRLEFNELTQSVFLKVLDYSDFDDQKELQDLWDSLVDALKKTVGG